MKYLLSKLGNITYFLAIPLIGRIINNSNRARVVITYNSKILVSKNLLGNNKWSLPGGGIQKNETAEQAAIREIHEELGLNLKPSDLKFKHDIGFKDRWAKLNLSIFEANLSKKQPIKLRKWEIIDAKWLAISELNETNTNADVFIALATHKS